IQEWEAGVSHPTAERLQGLIRALLASGGFTPGQEPAEASDFWTAAERDSPRMHTPFDPVWFFDVLPSNPSIGLTSKAPGSTAERLEDWNEAPDTEGFVGRSEELAQLRSWVLDDRCRLVALVGFGGIGKTMLAARVAQRVASNFERAYWR